MTEGGPEDKTRFVAMFVYDQAFQYQRLGYASAVAWVLFLIIVALDDPGVPAVKKRVYYAGTVDDGAADSQLAPILRLRSGERQSRGRTPWYLRLCVHGVLAVGGVFFLLPLVWMVATSLKPLDQTMKTPDSLAELLVGQGRRATVACPSPVEGRAGRST